MLNEIKYQSGCSRGQGLGRPWRIRGLGWPWRDCLWSPTTSPQKISLGKVVARSGSFVKRALVGPSEEWALHSAFEGLALAADGSGLEYPTNDSGLTVSSTFTAVRKEPHCSIIWVSCGGYPINKIVIEPKPEKRLQYRITPGHKMRVEYTLPHIPRWGGHPASGYRAIQQDPTKWSPSCSIECCGLVFCHISRQRQQVSNITQRFIDRKGDADHEEQWQVSSKHNEQSNGNSWILRGDVLAGLWWEIRDQERRSAP